MGKLTKQQVIHESFYNGKCGDLYIYSDVSPSQYHPEFSASNAHPEGWGFPDLWAVTSYKNIGPFRRVVQYVPKSHNYMYKVVPAIYELHIGHTHFWVFTIND